ncbi:MAG: molybdenum cofactor biosynthesis protein MoaB [Planctomycetes bacterium]|nr:molybdenum cofactor biosynthesis protein MoaB [Planctomycetota bacterium]
MGLEEHRRNAAARVSAGIITVSDTRSLETDGSGLEIERLLKQAGHSPVCRTVVPDEPALIAMELRRQLSASDIEAIILNGGTGLAARDGTVEVVRHFLDREIPGFGELFRYLSHQEIGSAAMLSRAVAGIAAGKAVFSLPGSPNAVALAMEKLILPELGHILGELGKGCCRDC